MGTYDKQMATISSTLQPGETIIAHIKATLGGVSGPIVATNQRFVFVGTNGLKRENRTYPWQQVTALEHEVNRIGVDHLTVSVASDRMKFLVPRGAAMAQFVVDARSALSQAREVGATVPAAPGVADQLVRLSELHAAGVVTDEEFAAKKAQLLERM